MKFCGMVGYGLSKESAPGVWRVVIDERKYYGDVLSTSSRWEKTENQNDNLVLNNQISIMADAFAFENAACIRYVKWMGAAWKVSTIEFKRPRLVLTLGEVYSGEEKEDEEESGTPDAPGGDSGES